MKKIGLCLIVTAMIFSMMLANANVNSIAAIEVPEPKCITIFV